MTTTAYLLERAWVDGAVHEDVMIEIEGGRFTSVEVPGPFRNTRSTGHSGTRIPGLTLPGLANCHSHAFHRALRGRTQRGRGTFWTWREQMYAVAGRLDPDSYFALARATYREMVAAGITAVGEFHYLHHQPDGTAYDDPNAMGWALIEAAREAGIRIALLDTCYLSSGFGAPVEGVQVRYSDGDARAWRARVESLRLLNENPDVVVGAAVHSVRAVPRDQLSEFVDFPGPVHAHVSEQVAENEQCEAAYGMSPTYVLADAGLLGNEFTAVHATHLDDRAIETLGTTGTRACFCPTTERDLGDGVGPSRQLHEAGSPLTLGSDSHAVIDLFEEMRAVELDERLATHERGHWSAAELIRAATSTGHASLGFADAGEIRQGHRADLVTIDTSSPRTAGTGADEGTAVFAASAADVTQVIVDGRIVVEQGDRERIGRDLAEIIDRLHA